MPHAGLTRLALCSPERKTGSTLVEREQLLLIDVVAGHGVAILQTVWATTADVRFGHRRTEVETVANLDDLVHRLNALAAVMFGLDRLAAAA
jgi:hypothetical protein